MNGELKLKSLDSSWIIEALSNNTLHTRSHTGMRVLLTHIHTELHSLPLRILSLVILMHCFAAERPPIGIAQQWIQSKREAIVSQMTEACLNQSLDALLSRDLIMKEDYELISTKPTRTSKVRQLLDTSDIQGEEFAKVVVQKLKDNKQLGMQHYPEVTVLSKVPPSNFPQNKSL